MLQIHKEGRRAITITCILIVALAAVILYTVPQPFKAILGIGLLVFLGLVISFFRVPQRDLINVDSNQIIAPADGKVVVIEEVEDEEFEAGRYLQISIFMSPLNVHINWYPCFGKVVYTKHHHGKFLVAWHPKSSVENERTTTVINRGEHNIIVRQVAGAVARRIVNYAAIGNEVKLSQQLGFIKFGSRVDVLLPVSAQIKVALDEKAKGGQTIIATLP
ncbi:UNVERIFIED_CONTAM: hypothetical protein GTU68_033055 [Idotea baltica]|nr:hypothetical protein [Idotea baltica]